MAYTPINWQTGDTITAAKLNRCDNGWGYESTEILSETVTTADTYSGGYGVGELAYSQFINSPTIVVTFDGTDYTCPNTIPSMMAESPNPIWDSGFIHSTFIWYRMNISIIPSSATPPCSVIV